MVLQYGILAAIGDGMKVQGEGAGLGEQFRYRLLLPHAAQQQEKLLAGWVKQISPLFFSSPQDNP